MFKRYVINVTSMNVHYTIFYDISFVQGSVDDYKQAVEKTREAWKIWREVSL